MAQDEYTKVLQTLPDMLAVHALHEEFDEKNAQLELLLKEAGLSPDDGQWNLDMNNPKHLRIKALSLEMSDNVKKVDCLLKRIDSWPKGYQ